MDIRYLKFKTPHEKRAFHVSGVGIREKMQSGIVDRPDGTGDRLLMFFYDPIQIEVHGKVKSFPGNTLMLWKDKSGHWYGNEKIPWSHSWIHFHGTKAQAVLAEGDLNSGEAIQFNRPEIMTNWLSIIYKELISQIKPDQIILKNLFQCMIHDISRSCKVSETLEISERILKVKNILEKNPEIKRSLKELASTVYLSVPHFCAEFKRCVGISPINYQIQLRMQRARYLLHNRNLSISEIAQMSGYSDIFQFSKTFKKFFLHNPSCFRK